MLPAFRAPLAYCASYLLNIKVMLRIFPVAPDSLIIHCKQRVCQCFYQCFCFSLDVTYNVQLI